MGKPRLIWAGSPVRVIGPHHRQGPRAQQPTRTSHVGARDAVSRCGTAVTVQTEVLPSVRPSPPFGPLGQHPLCQTESTVRSTCSTSPLSDRVHRSVHLFNIPSVRPSPPFGPFVQLTVVSIRTLVRRRVASIRK